MVFFPEHAEKLFIRKRIAQISAGTAIIITAGFAVVNALSRLIKNFSKFFKGFEDFSTPISTLRGGRYWKIVCEPL